MVIRNGDLRQVALIRFFVVPSNLESLLAHLTARASTLIMLHGVSAQGAGLPDVLTAVGEEDPTTRNSPVVTHACRSCAT